MNISFRTIGIGLLLTLLIPLASQVHGADCASQACITVRTDPERSGIVITAIQVSPGKTSSPHPKYTIPKPVVSTIHKPKSHATPAPTPRSALHASTRRTKIQNSSIRQQARKSRATSAPKPSEVAAVSLSDTLTQLLPGRAIYYQPSNYPVTGLPVTLASDAPNIFSTVTTILGISVGVSLHPQFEWNFGDDSPTLNAYQTTVFPNPGVAHIFHKSGNYLVTLTISWSGSWSAGGFTYPVLGQAIVQKISTLVPVKSAPTRYFQ